MESPVAGAIDYAALLESSNPGSLAEKTTFLTYELPYEWCDAYLLMTNRPVGIVRVVHGSFEYIYDHYTVASDDAAFDLDAESRLVGVLGHSAVREASRMDSRLRGWVGPTEKTFGKEWDKGHFIAHSIGGAVDRREINVFLQRRDLNRGWSAEGAIFRSMEKYCVNNPGTFCFSRPLYIDESSKPAVVEFGLLKLNGTLWVVQFKNQY